MRSEVETLLRRLQLEPIIDQPNQGMPTVIEKLEREAQPAGYAIVILSPEDWRRGPERDGWPEAPNSARENVLLELGYFFGKLGRRNVTALHLPGMELPSASWMPFGHRSTRAAHGDTRSPASSVKSATRLT